MCEVHTTPYYGHRVLLEDLINAEKVKTPPSSTITREESIALISLKRTREQFYQLTKETPQ
jgi:hypothetical protein